jgi:hypothetical protein
MFQNEIKFYEFFHIVVNVHNCELSYINEYLRTESIASSYSCSENTSENTIADILTLIMVVLHCYLSRVAVTNKHSRVGHR